MSEDKRQDALIQLALAKAERALTLSGGAAVASFVYRVGYLGVPGPFIFPTFAAAVAAASVDQRAHTTIEIDDSAGPAVVTPGAYDLTNVDLIGNNVAPGATVTKLTFQQGATLTGLWASLTLLNIDSVSTNPVFTAPAGDLVSYSVFRGGGVGASAGPAAPFFLVPAAAAVTVVGENFVAGPKYANVAATGTVLLLLRGVASALFAAPTVVSGVGALVLVLDTDVPSPIAAQTTPATTTSWLNQVGSSFVLRPNQPGLTGPVEFTSFADLCAALNTSGGSSGPKTIVFDDDNGAGIVIPAGVYPLALRSASVELRPIRAQMLIDLADGVVLQGGSGGVAGYALRVSGELAIRSNGTAAAPITLARDQSLELHLDDGATLETAAGATFPFIDLPNVGSFVDLYMKTGAGLFAAGALPVVRAGVGNVTGLLASCSVATGSLAGAASISLTLEDTGVALAPQAGAAALDLAQSVAAVDKTSSPGTNPGPVSGLARLAVAGTLLVATRQAKANSRIFLSVQDSGGAQTGFIQVTARNPGVSFSITSSAGAADNGVDVAWFIVQPAGI